jgi:chemotaxis family two-component system response regulator Rcp1
MGGEGSMNIRMALPPIKDRIPEILLVEDNAGDVRLMREVLREIGLNCNLHVAGDGVQAMAMLRREGAYRDLPTPDLVLLDLNLPLLSGIEVLERVKSDPLLRVVPVLMLTTSSADSDVLTCYTLNVNTYLVKPADFDEFSQMMSSIQNYWLEQAQRPPVSVRSPRELARERAGP